MGIQQIVKYPDEALKVPCVPVTSFESKEFKALVQDLLDTAKAYRAQGLAANQIGGKLRVFVSKVDDGTNDYKVFVNPVLQLEGDLVKNHEGCLSFPGVKVLVERPEECTVKAKDADGVEFGYYIDDIESVAIQHENDHLDGVTVIDRISGLTKRRFLTKLRKASRVKNPNRRRGR